MIVNENETRNFTAVSAVDVENGSGIPVVYMSAVLEKSNLSFSKRIQNIDLYKDHKEETDADWKEFQSRIENIMIGG